MGKSRIYGGTSSRVSDSIEAYFQSAEGLIRPDTLVSIVNGGAGTQRSTGILIDNACTYDSGYPYVKIEDLDETHILCAFIKGVDDSGSSPGQGTVTILDISQGVPEVVSMLVLDDESVDMSLCRLSARRFAITSGRTGNMDYNCYIHIVDATLDYQINKLSQMPVKMYYRPVIFAYSPNTFLLSYRANTFGLTTDVYTVDDNGELTKQSSFGGSFGSFVKVDEGLLFGTAESGSPSVSILHLKNYTISLDRTLNLCKYPSSGSAWTTIYPVLQDSCNKFYIVISGSGKGRYLLSYADDELTVLNHVDASAYSDYYTTDVPGFLDLHPKLGLVTYDRRLALLDYTALGGLGYTELQVFDAGGGGLSRKCTDIKMLNNNTVLVLFTDINRRLHYALVDLNITSWIRKGYCTVDGITKQNCDRTKPGKIKIFT